MPSTSPCTLRYDAQTEQKGAHSDIPAATNTYNHNFTNHFCGCGEQYDAAQEKGIMFQCLGLGTTETGGCGEDWWHPQCLLGLGVGWREGRGQDEVVPKKNEDASSATPEDDEAKEAEDEDQLPPGFPDEKSFDAMICYKCVGSNPWIKRYAGTEGFLDPVFTERSINDTTSPMPSSAEEQSRTTVGELSGKRRRSDEEDTDDAPHFKRVKEASESEPHIGSESDQKLAEQAPLHKHDQLPQAPEGSFSLFLKEDFREHLCHCPNCYRKLISHPQLLEEEETYEPPISEEGDSEAAPALGAKSTGTGSLLDRGEAALSNMDRVKAIEGVMVYNHLKDKVKSFLKPFAESGQAVGAEDIKAYFEKLRGDDAAIKEAAARRTSVNGSDETDRNDHRKEQGGY